MIPVREHQHRIAELDELMTRAGFWNDQQRAADLTKERQHLVSLLDELKRMTDDTELLCEYAEAFPEDDSIREQADALLASISAFELRQILSGEHDRAAAILMISAGAGGLESANWVSILARQYMRYANMMGMKVEILDEKPSEENSSICTDSITVQISGEYAYGYLKTENGIMRLIRASPFSSGDLRHTSFAAISVIPDIDDSIEVVIDDKDIEITAIRSSGPGGQNSNKVSSCIRLHHKPSGIIVKASTERSQLDNRRNAFRILKAKLYDLEMKKREAEQNKTVSNLADNSFGHQIRTYTMTPYSLVSDHRTGHKSNQVDQVLDGDIHPFIIAALHKKIKS